MLSAPPLIIQGNEGWNFTSNTPSSPFFLCAENSCIHVFDEISHKRIEESWPPDTRVDPVEFISKLVTASR